MFLKNTFLAGAVTAAAMALASAAGAVTLQSVSNNGAPAVDGGTVGISIGDIFQINILSAGDGSDNGSGAGTFSFGFTASELLVAIDTQSQNPAAGFSNAFLEWNTAADGSGTTLASTVVDGNNSTLQVQFQENDTLFLIATYDDVLEALADYDIRVTASPVPVPAGMVLMGTALAGFGIARRRKKA